MVVEHNWRSTWRCPLSKLRYAPHGGSCGEIEGRELTINTPPNLSRHPNGIRYRESGSSIMSIGRGWEDMILPGCEDLSNRGKSEWDQKLEREYAYLCCMIRWDGNEMLSIYPGVCRIHTPCHSVYLRYPCISLNPPSLFKDVLCRPLSSQCGDALRDRDQWIDKMELETVIEQVWRYTSRRRSIWRG